MAGKQPYPPPGNYPQPPAPGYPQGPPPGYQAPPPAYQAPPPGYQAPPPGYQAPPPYQPPGATHHTVVVQQVPQKTVVQKPARGLFGSFMKEVDLLAKQAGREIDYCAGKVNQAVDQTANNPVLNYFQTGNVVQLISRVSGRSLQIVATPAGQLVVDGCGPTDHQQHTLWTVVNEGSNQVRLHNNNNYLTIVNNNTTLVTMPPGSVHGVETKLQLGVAQTQFVIMQSVKDPLCHVGVLPTGLMKPARATGRENSAQFGVRLVYTPYGQQVTTVKK
ncbi:uncharacterized protein [Haliotis cracherodii]|uniref:uncharacterized protein n=1 Tax=Haliotis cracherodii TaxID=6455 RepID=UPI0039E8DD98